MDIEQYGIDYWRQRALQAEEIAKMHMESAALDAKEVAEVIARHVSDNLALKCNVYSGSLDMIYAILSKMIEDQSISFDVVNNIVTNIQLLKARMEHIESSAEASITQEH